MMDPGRALATAEQALRELLRAAMSQALGANWLAQVTKQEQVEKWRTRRRDEEAKRGKKGVASVPQDELSYAELYELIDIAEKHWTYVAPALGKKADTAALLRRMENLRNTVGHSRELLPFEADLLSGIAGEIRNRVTIYMSSQDPSGEYYPRIEYVRDQFGNESTGVTGSARPVSTGHTIAFGSTVKFQCRATDPQGRELIWAVGSDMAVDKKKSTEGGDVELEWSPLSASEVGDRINVFITVRSPSEFHRTSIGDDYAMFKYRVTPPN